MEPTLPRCIEKQRHGYDPLPAERFDTHRVEKTFVGSLSLVRFDRVAQAAALNILNPILEAQFDDCSYGYRRGRSVRQAVAQVRNYYNQGYCWLVDSDIDAYFECVPQDRLMEKVSALIQDEGIQRLIRLWLEADVWDGEQVTHMTVGLPQGSVISPVLANLYLDEFDDAMLKKGMRLVRYADDFVILCKNREQAEQAARLTDEILDRMGLELDESDIRTFDAGFSFLGVTFFRSMIMVPFECERRSRRVLYAPPPLDLATYRRAADPGDKRG
jgi:RNA-directed DNA polymerase